jgi:hypothetical protein
MTQDPYTHERVPGVLLKLSKYSRHQEDEAVFNASEDAAHQQSIEITIMAKSLDTTVSEDPLVILTSL